MLHKLELIVLIAIVTTLSLLTWAGAQLGVYPGLMPFTAGHGVEVYGTGTGIIEYVDGWPLEWPSASSGRSVNYLIAPPEAGAAVGKIMLLEYSIDSPDGSYPSAAPVDGFSYVPARMYMFIWQNGDNGQNPNARWWCFVGQGLNYGDGQTYTCPIDPKYWSNVNGQPASQNPAAFAAAVANPFAMGVTFGGEFFGHGVQLTAPGRTIFSVTRWELD